MDPVQLLVWVVIIVFAITALITLGGLVENFKIIQVNKIYLNKLFVVLILEVVAVCIPLFTEVVKESRCGDDCVLERIKQLDSNSQLAKEILRMRNTFTGIFSTSEQNITISFETFEGKTNAKVCPRSPFFMSNVMIFPKSRIGGALVIPVTAVLSLCTNGDHDKIVINSDLATSAFGLKDSTETISGFGRVIPPNPRL